MAGLSDASDFPTPTIVTLGDSAILVRFGSTLTDAANRAALALSLALEREPLAGVAEVAPNLVSVLVRYDALDVSSAALMGELRLRLFGLSGTFESGRVWQVNTQFDGPDLSEVAELVRMGIPDFVAAHNRTPLRILATGFAPGFVYCGLHDRDLVVPRRAELRPSVPAGSVLFAAGQTAIAATELPTGWHVIGRTGFANFDVNASPPTVMQAGDAVRFQALP